MDSLVKRELFVDSPLPGSHPYYTLTHSTKVETRSRWFGTWRYRRVQIRQINSRTLQQELGGSAFSDFQTAMAMAKLHGELSSYMQAHRVIDLHRERFNRLSEDANRLYPSLMDESLQPRPAKELLKEVARHARQLRHLFDVLYRAILDQEKMGGVGAMGDFLQELSAAEIARGEDTARFDALSSEYNSYMRRLQELP